tara:strand:- start:379 stop:579 length:201 start_codon:yes stop_codon:yes gene_type:complete
MSNNSKPFNLIEDLTSLMEYTTYYKRKKQKEDRIKPATHKVGTTQGIQLGQPDTQSGTSRSKKGGY